MAWIESHQSLGQHPKVFRMASQLQIDKVYVVGHLFYLWWWALDYAKDGDLSKFHSSEVAEAGQWGGVAEEFCMALKNCGWIDDDGKLHDWSHYAGRYLLGLQRQKRYRDKQVTSPLRNSDVTVTPIVQYKHNSTVPTEQTEQTKIDKRFQRPSPQEVVDYGKQIGYVGVDGQQFCDFYESKGWRVGNTPMKDWKAAVRTWKKRGGGFGGSGKTQIQVGATGGFQQTKQPLF